MPKNDDKIKYFLYARKSSESEDRQVASIEDQVKEMEKLARENNLRIIKTFSESMSAKAPLRPVFDEMIERINKGEADGVLCWKLNRLARNPIDGGRISWMLQEGIIKHIQTFGRSYYPDDNVIVMAVELGMANQFIRDLSVDTKRGLRNKVQNGWRPGPAPVGYHNLTDKKIGEREIGENPENFSLIKKALKLMLTGEHKPDKILKIMNEKWRFRMPKGGPMTRGTLYRILSNSFYCGEFEYPKGSNSWYHGKHKAMISKDEFNRIQMLLGRDGKPRPQKHNFAFTGTIRCGECGAMITAEEKIKVQKNGNIHRYVYYHCTKKKNPNCTQGYIREKELKKQILETLDKIEIPKEFHEWAMDKLKAEIGTESKDRNEMIVRQQKEYNACLREIDGIIGMRAKGELDEDNYKRKMSALTKEKSSLKELMNNADNEVNKQIEKIEKAFNLAKDAKERFMTDDPDVQRSVLSDLGSNFTLKNGKLSVLIEKPLIHIEIAATEVKKIHKRLEPLGMPFNIGEIKEIYSQSPILLRG